MTPELYVNTYRHWDRLAGGNAVSACLRVLVHEGAVHLAAASRLSLPVARDLLAVFLLNKDNFIIISKQINN